MAREDLHFRLRIPEDLKNRVAEAAERNHRSMTAEIIARLELSFADEPPHPLSPEERKFALHEMTARERWLLFELAKQMAKGQKDDDTPT